MLRWLYRKLSNRHNIAPPLEYKVCCVPGCGMDAAEQWLPSVCALRQSGVDVDWMPVCAEHDVQLNEVVTRLIFGDRYDAELAAYRSRMNASPSDF